MRWLWVKHVFTIQLVYPIIVNDLCNVIKRMRKSTNCSYIQIISSNIIDWPVNDRRSLCSRVLSVPCVSLSTQACCLPWTWWKWTLSRAPPRPRSSPQWTSPWTSCWAASDAAGQGTTRRTTAYLNPDLHPAGWSHRPQKQTSTTTAAQPRSGMYCCCFMDTQTLYSY